MTAPSRATAARKWRLRTTADDNDNHDGTPAVRKIRCRPQLQSLTTDDLERESREWERVTTIGLNSDWTCQTNLAILPCKRGSTLLTYKARYGPHDVITMVDSGAARNFMSTKAAKQLRLKLRAVRQQFAVTIANEDRIPIRHFVIAKLRLGERFTLRSVFYVIPNSYDVILGLPFLQRYRPVLDWREGTMQVRYRGVVCHIQPAARPARVQGSLINSLTSEEEEKVEGARRETTTDIPTMPTHPDAPAAETQYYLAVLETGEMDDDFVHGSEASQEATWPPTRCAP